eukprot:TRINITY_DN1316_c0_g1_i4.p2 TRINITY_DN1316_c0_g1~~TRINITY_DN1316_c0_g1_i4.p2  ORF type:complete len:341 (+),score=99.34 TRINITY_DN1316_c0_g1_i4:118-1023(+)
MAPPMNRDAPIAIVTGANSGIGLAVTVALARSGHTVYAGMRDAASPDDLLAAAAADAASSAGDIHILRMDVGDTESVNTAVASVLAATDDRIDVAVANAGYGVAVNVEVATVAECEAVMNVNYDGSTFGVVKAVVAVDASAGAGRMVGVSSLAGLVGFPFCAPYAASKFAMEGLWESCSAEYKSLGVHFSLVEPGPVAAGMESRGLADNFPPGELTPIRAAYNATTLHPMLAKSQSTTECAEYVLRAAIDSAPALRYITYKPLEAVVRTKFADLDGAGMAAALAAMVVAPSTGEKQATAGK